MPLSSVLSAPVDGETTAFKPIELATRWRTDLDTIYQLIKSRKLAGFDVSGGKKRPSWRIAAEEVARFEAGKPASPPGRSERKKARREQRPPDWIEFV